MKKTFTFSEELDYDFDRVWEVLHDPSIIFKEHASHYEIISPTHWIDHTSEDVDNESHATIDEAAHTIHVTTENSKYRHETADITITLEKIPEGCELHVRYIVGTTAIFNIVAFELMGKKIISHVTNTVYKNIKKQLEA